MIERRDIHPIPERVRSAVVYNRLGDSACSICAPLTMTKEEVETFANVAVERTNGGRWQAVDKSKPPISLPPATPNPCNVYQSRQHWFLIGK